MGVAPPRQLEHPNISQRMKDAPNWIGWRREAVNGKSTKVPSQVKCGGKRLKAATDNPDTWATFDEALAAYQNPAIGLDGIGFVFTEDVPLVGLDLDHCLDPDTGELEPWAGEIVDAMSSDTSVSPSGDGLHIIVEVAQAPFEGKKTSKRIGDKGKLELFAHGVFFTVTGEAYGEPRPVRFAQHELDSLYRRLWQNQEPAPRPDFTAVPAAIDDSALLERMFAAKKNGADNKALWEGELSAHGGDHSAADMALCNHLAWWCDYDAGRMDALFRRSKLMRPKWDEKHYSDGTTYGQGTVTAALAGKRPGEGFRPKTGNARDPKQSKQDAAGATGRPEIVVNGRYMRDITAGELGALQRANDPLRLFVRAGIPVRVDSLARAEALTAASLKGEMDRAADHVKEEYKPNRDGELERITTPARPPTDVANDILALPSLPFPELRSIAHVPQVLPGGAILSRDGYDPETGILLRLRGLEDARLDLPLAEARALLVDELLGDFPFTDEGSRAHAVAMLLQPFLMPLITGATPLYLIDAPTRGTGKTLLYQVIAYIVLGAYPAVMTLTREGDELDKRITASLLEGDVMIVLDNIVTRLASDKLAAVLTSRRYRGRRLGKSEMLTVNNDATWVATGNNVEVSDEMARRIMPIRLDAGLERPEEGRRFKHPDLLAYVQHNRPRLVSACLSLIRSWVEAGMPEGRERVGSFESWAGIMGGILAHAEVPHLLSGRERFAGQADRETTEWAALTAAWWATFGKRAVNASELFSDVIKDRSLLMDTWAGRAHLPALQRIGRALSSRRDRVYGGYVIRDAGQDAVTKSAAYRLEERAVGNKTPETPQTDHKHRQGHENATGVLGAETPVKPPETPRNPPPNPRSTNAVQDDENDALRGFRGFEEQLSENFDELIGATEGEL